MRWSDLLIMAESTVGQTIGDTSAYFFKKYALKLYASSMQASITKQLNCLEGYKTFSTVALTQEYDIPADFSRVIEVKYGDTYYLDEITKRAQDVNDENGTPVAFYVRGYKLGFYPKPNEVETISMWYKRLAAPYAIRIENAGNTTNAAVSVTSTGITVAYDGPATATYTFSANATVTAIVAAINAAIATTKIKATKCSTFDGDRASSLLETIGSASLLQNDMLLFIDPELPEEYQTSILLNAMSYRLTAIDGELQDADRYKKYMEDAIEHATKEWKKRNHGSRNLRPIDAYTGRGGFYLGYGKSIIVP